MPSNQNDPKKDTPQAQDKQQQGQRKQPGQQDRQNINEASDAQLNQGQGNQRQPGRQGQHGSARDNPQKSERDENMQPEDSGSRQSGRGNN
jgi:hypothetical protein